MDATAGTTSSCDCLLKDSTKVKAKAKWQPRLRNRWKELQEDMPRSPPERVGVGQEEEML